MVCEGAEASEGNQKGCRRRAQHIIIFVRSEGV